MENFNHITFAKTRNFSEKVNATFEFLKQNFKSLAWALLIIAGPSVLITVVLLGSFMDDIFASISAENANPDAVINMFSSANFWIQLALMLGFFMVATVMSFSAINHYMVLYDEKRTPNIDASLVWDRVRATFWSYTGAMLMFFVLLAAIYTGLALFMVALAAISPILMFVGLLVVYGGIAWFMVSSSMTFFIMTYEKRGFFDALARSFRLIQGEWWSSFGFYIIIYFVMSALAMAFIIPIYIVAIVVIVHSIEENRTGLPPSLEWIFIIMMGGYYFFSVFLQLLPNVAVVLQYFNLVEQKESRGLMGRIESLGETPVSGPVASEEHY